MEEIIDGKRLQVRYKDSEKRLINPDDCNPKCVMGYTFEMDKEQYQKCLYMVFQPTLNEEVYV